MSDTTCSGKKQERKKAYKTSGYKSSLRRQNWCVRSLALSERLFINGDADLFLSGGLLLTGAPYFLGKGFLSFVGLFRSACPFRPAFQCPCMSRFFYSFYFSLAPSGQEMFIWGVRTSNFESKNQHFFNKVPTSRFLV
jgi:hypothetical protein